MRWGSINAAGVKKVPDAVYVLSNLWTGLGTAPFGRYFTNGMDAILLNWGLLRRIVLLDLIPLALYDYFSLKTDVCGWLGERNPLIRYAYILAVVLIILIYGYVGQSTFVYFQF